MKLVMLGNLDESTVRELAGVPCVVITGTADEVRAVAHLFARRVEVTEAKPLDPDSVALARRPDQECR